MNATNAMGTQVDVSIILTSYNYERFLPRAIESARAQQTPNLEIVIVDNASTDGSWALIEAASAEDPRISAYRNETNIGMVGNHNRGLELARGKRVLFLSADDLLLPGHVDTLIAAHAMHPEIDVFYTSYFKVDEHERIIEYVGHHGHLRGSHYGGRNEFADLLTYDCYICTPTALWDKAAMEAGGGFDTGLVAGDLELCLRLAAQGKTFAYLDTPGACVRIHEREITGERNYVATGRQLLDHLYLMERYVRRENARLMAGREHGLARLLNAKINNLRAYPESASAIFPNAQPRIEAIAATLNDLANASRSAALPRTPRISVVLQCGEDAAAALAALAGIVRQKYAQTEVVVVAEGRRDITPLLRSQAHGLTMRIVRHSGTFGRAAALNDALKLASGDIVTYADVAADWPDGHLARISESFRANAIDALAVPVDVLAMRGGKPAMRQSRFAGSCIAQPGAFLGEAVPLCAFAHRRRLVDQLGAFEERLSHLSDFEFVRRMFGGAAVGLLDGPSVTLRRAADAVHPALSDPAGYVSALQAVYNSSNMGPELLAQSQAHLQHVQRSIARATASIGAGGTFRFWSDVRGVLPAAPSAGAQRRSRPRILVIDDRVPYRELGRGYPRAYDALEELEKLGDVVFYPLLVAEDAAPLDCGIPGIDILYGRGVELLAQTLEQVLPTTDILWVSRPHNMELVRKALVGLPLDRSWKLIYDAEAIYAHRDIVKAELAGTPLSEPAQRALIDREVALLDGADAVFAVSEFERRAIGERCASPTRVLSFRLHAAPTPQTHSQRSGLLFVGAIEPGSPNDDALAWFVEHVAPLLKNRMQITHAGVINSPALRERASGVVQFRGIVADLRDEYSGALAFIAPTRYAAGLPQKVYEAAANGVPVIATPLLAHQLGWTHERELLVARTPQEWIAAIDRLANDATLWQSLRDAALQAVARDVSPETFASRIGETIRSLAGASPQGGVRLSGV